ncbi:MAG: PQQ-binding-like beta-propeller repeat protein, partial [Bryobacteraceae bacterium]|nr:PQQ-binding-like beta-propeller repeat protein [Bryobacteraceae bacterium]
LIFGDTKANVYGVRAATGERVWKVKADDHAFARITGSPSLHAGRVYVPVSSAEEVPAANPRYPCCSFRGSVVALDTATGRQLWKSYTIPTPAGSGGAVWLSPTIDVKRGVLYVGTGNEYKDPPSEFTDAIIAFDLATGERKWHRQMTPNDRWNMACVSPNKESCPKDAGEDFDFGAAPLLIGNRIYAGQKSGIVHALDADRLGVIVWQTRVGKGGALGGVEFGIGADSERLYVPLSDWSPDPKAGGGLFALQLATGEKLWHTPAPAPACIGKPGCNAAQMAPPTVLKNVVFSGSMDGHLRAYETKTGKIVWDFDTLRDFETVNKVPAKGGALNAVGPVVVGDWVYVQSGYGSLGGMPGNVLLAFSID